MGRWHGGNLAVITVQRRGQMGVREGGLYTWRMAVSARAMSESVLEQSHASRLHTRVGSGAYGALISITAARHFSHRLRFRRSRAPPTPDRHVVSLVRM